MKPLTDEELIEVLRVAGNGERRVSMSELGIFLRTKAGTYEINFAQAETLFTTMFGHAPTSN